MRSPEGFKGSKKLNFEGEATGTPVFRVSGVRTLAGTVVWLVGGWLLGMAAAGGGGGPGGRCWRKCSWSSTGGLPCCCLSARLMLGVASYLKFAVLHPLWRRVRFAVVALKSSPSNPRFLYISQLLHDYLKFCLMEGNWLDRFQYLFICSSSSFVRPWYKIGSFLKNRKSCILVHSREQSSMHSINL